MSDKKEKGYFITFEGPDGSGKSTQIDLLYKSLKDKGVSCICTREPGGTALGEKMREVLKDPALNDHLSIKTEALLLQTARAQHVYELILPALREGETVLCDRFSDSSTAYQGIARGLGESTIKKLNEFSTSDLTPDLTIILDISPEEGLKRAEDRDPNAAKDRWEEQKMSFHHKVRNAFLKLAEEEPERCKVITVQRTIEATHKLILNIVKNELGLL